MLSDYGFANKIIYTMRHLAWRYTPIYESQSTRELKLKEALMQGKKIFFIGRSGNIFIKLIGIFAIVLFALLLLFFFNFYDFYDFVLKELVIFAIFVTFVFYLLIFFWSYGTGLVRLILKYRKTFLVLAGISGMILAYGVYDSVSDIESLYHIENEVLQSSLTILALGLPTFFILWLFRTHDVQENINNSTFFECARMLVEETQEEEDTQEREDTKKRYLSTKIALEQLAYLRRETGFSKKRIDFITQELNLDRINLKGARLSGLDLSGAKLSKADLSNADLNRVKLIDANLDAADLSGTNLRYAYLQGANLSNFVDDVKDKDKWDFTTYNSETKFGDTWLAIKEARDEANMKAMSIEEAENKNKRGIFGV